METKQRKLKEIVREKYTQIADRSGKDDKSSCCSSGNCCEVDYAVFSESYAHVKGYNEEADLGLGCGIPTQFTRINPGDTVLDLGSGAGNDCFVAREAVGEKGRVIGLDFSESMVEKARNNAAKLGYTNIEFVTGDIEEMPLPSDSVDIVLSNCVLNLVPDKNKAFGEIFRVLKPGGSFSISDVVLLGDLKPELKKSAALYAGCVSGAIRKEDYLRIIERTGFCNIEVPKVKVIELPDELLGNFLPIGEIRAFRASGTGIVSITVTAHKP